MTVTLRACSKGVLQPHRWRYWLTPSTDVEFEAKVQDICQLYQQAPQLLEAGERVVSTDEMTGIQALERAHPGLQAAPGQVERREFEYIRHGTRALVVSRDVAFGHILAPRCGTTRTEDDFLAHVQAVVASDLNVQRWHFVVDNLIRIGRKVWCAGLGPSLIWNATLV